jgi:hypothetical protein
MERRKHEALWLNPSCRGYRRTDVCGKGATYFTSDMHTKRHRSGWLGRRAGMAFYPLGPMRPNSPLLSAMGLLGADLAFMRRDPIGALGLAEVIGEAGKAHTWP